MFILKHTYLSPYMQKNIQTHKQVSSSADH